MSGGDRPGRRRKINKKECQIHEKTAAADMRGQSEIRGNSCGVCLAFFVGKFIEIFLFRRKPRGIFLWQLLFAESLRIALTLLFYRLYNL
mgnify:CR=1 FL=1